MEFQLKREYSWIELQIIRMNRKEILNLLSNKKIYVYGTGYVASQFVEGLKINGLMNNFVAYIETWPKKSYKNGMPVLSANEIENVEGTIICVAVHESLVGEIVTNLEKNGIANYIWVAPFVARLNFGDPIQENIQISVKEIIQKQIGYGVAIRSLALEEFLGKNEIGYSIYKKYYGYCGDRNTAEKRLEQFQRTIDSWRSNGYDDFSVISIDENMQIMDGVHRVTLANYFGPDEVMANIYPANEKFFCYIGGAVLKDKDDLKRMGISDSEIEYVIEKKKEQNL